MKALILMTRIPIPGKTKTRLMEIFSGKACADIHKCFLLDLFNVFKFLKEDIDIFLTYTPEASLNIIEDMIPKYIQCFPSKILLLQSSFPIPILRQDTEFHFSFFAALLTFSGRCVIWDNNCGRGCVEMSLS